MTGPFGRETAEVYKGIKKEVEDRPVKNAGDEVVPEKAIDRNVKEQVIGDLDHLIKKNEDLKY